jgi:hypothetical protein
VCGCASNCRAAFCTIGLSTKHLPEVVGVGCLACIFLRHACGCAAWDHQKFCCAFWCARGILACTAHSVCGVLRQRTAAVRAQQRCEQLCSHRCCACCSTYTCCVGLAAAREFHNIWRLLCVCLITSAASGMQGTVMKTGVSALLFLKHPARVAGQQQLLVNSPRTFGSCDVFVAAVQCQVVFGAAVGHVWVRCVVVHLQSVGLHHTTLGAKLLVQLLQHMLCVCSICCSVHQPSHSCRSCVSCRNS